MKKLTALLVALLPLMAAGAKPIEIKLWPDGAPNSNGLAPEAEDPTPGWVTGVSDPVLYVYPAAQPNGTAVIMCPGGAYIGLADTHEGHDMADWFNSMGVTYAVLKYRMPNGNCEIPLIDGEQAMRIMRAHADEWNVSPGSIGIMGASAGGHFASTLATHYTSPETRPDFQVLFYPVITMDPEIRHGSTRNNLMGPEQTAEKIHFFSNDEQVTPDTPKAFIMVSSDDDLVSPQNSILYYSALLRNGVPVALHSYPTGGHGWGFRDSFIYKPAWTAELERWLDREVIMK